MLSEFPGNSWHIGRLPGEYFPALTEELDERAFLCFSEALRHVDSLVLICWVNLLCMCLLSWTKFFGCRRSPVFGWLMVAEHLVDEGEDCGVASFRPRQRRQKFLMSFDGAE